MPRQNLSQLYCCDKIYFNFSVQFIANVLAILGADVLDQLLPWCSDLISYRLVAIIEDIVA